MISFKKHQKDPRINAPLISWKLYLIIFALLYFLVVGQALILSYFSAEFGTLIEVLLYYLLFTALLLTLYFGFLTRAIYGRPLTQLSKVARQVTQGDYTQRAPANRKDGKKDELAILIEDFNHMITTLQNTEIFKKDFIANVSHELKAPLSVMTAYANLLQQEELTDSERKKYVADIIRAVKSMTELITNILQLSKLERDGVRPQRQLYQLGEQLRKSALDLLPIWEEKGIDVQMDVIDCEVMSDKALLGLVWTNLLSNAIKFTPENGTVKVKSYIIDRYVCVTVSDTGKGMTEEEVKHIFEKFYQADLSHGTQGSGLGLSLVERIAFLLHLGLEVKTNAGKGTTFTIKIPL